MFKSFIITGYHFGIIFLLLVITFILVCNAYDKWVFESDDNEAEVKSLTREA